VAELCPPLIPDFQGRLNDLMKLDTWPASLTGSHMVVRSGSDQRPQVLEKLHLVLKEAWKNEPSNDTIDTVLKDVMDPKASAEVVNGSTTGRLRKRYNNEQRLWLRLAEEFAAVQAVAYIGWVLQHLRRIAVFLIGALLITTFLISSYWYQPQSLVKLLFLLVLLATVGGSIIVLVEMNRDALLSCINKGDPGRVNWSARFVLNLAVVGVVPLLALVSSEFPEVRLMLFSWLDPVLQQFTKL
jgi:hypothetical protein